jgi:hypothetical protein
MKRNTSTFDIMRWITPFAAQKRREAVNTTLAREISATCVLFSVRAAFCPSPGGRVPNTIAMCDSAEVSAEKARAIELAERMRADGGVQIKHRR